MFAVFLRSGSDAGAVCHLSPTSADKSGSYNQPAGFGSSANNTAATLSLGQFHKACPRAAHLGCLVERSPPSVRALAQSTDALAALPLTYIGSTRLRAPPRRRSARRGDRYRQYQDGTLSADHARAGAQRLELDGDYQVIHYQCDYISGLGTFTGDRGFSSAACARPQERGL